MGMLPFPEDGSSVNSNEERLIRDNDDKECVITLREAEAEICNELDKRIRKSVEQTLEDKRHVIINLSEQHSLLSLFGVLGLPEGQLRSPAQEPRSGSVHG